MPSLRYFAVALLCATTAAGCGGFGAASSIPNINNSAAPLPADNTFYLTDHMERARYGHTATPLPDGRVMVACGSDEAFFTSLDTVEIFDQAIRPDDVTVESITGVWISTDFQGDPIATTDGPRIFHTASLLETGNVVLIGGTFNALNSPCLGAAIFDVQGRTFNNPELEIVTQPEIGRCQHTATALPTGDLLIAGGRGVREFSIPIPDSFPPITVEVTVFPSTKFVEIFKPALRVFERAKDIEQNEDTAQLRTQHGRHQHGTGVFAGRDQRLNTNDDVYVHVGGSQTPSADLLATIGVSDKQPNITRSRGHAETSVEIYDPSVGIHTTVGNLSLAKRVSNVKILNLGVFQNTTPGPGGLPPPQGTGTGGGVRGVNNVISCMLGDDDGDGPNGSNLVTSTPACDVIAAIFTGSGPGDGIALELVTPSAGQFHNWEQINTPGPPCPQTYGRSASDAFMMRTTRVIADVQEVSSWAVTMSGVWLFPTPQGQGESLLHANCGFFEVLGVQFFDPFYNVLNILEPLDPAGNPIPSWDFVKGGQTLGNPTGIVGTWVNSDTDLVENGGSRTTQPAMPPVGTIPSLQQYDNGIGRTTLVHPKQAPNQGRCFHSLTRLPGQDGAINTPDDRVLLVGGADSWRPNGQAGEAVSFDTEIYLPPNANLQP